MRLTALVASLTTLLLVTPAALAGPGETRFLDGLTGAWKGKGPLTGAETGTVACDMTMRKRSDGGIAFRARCDAGDLGPQNFSGILSYNDSAKRYEALSAGGEVTVGTKSGNAVVFKSKLKGIATGETSMRIASNRIVVDTVARRSASAGDIKSRIELTK